VTADDEELMRRLCFRAAIIMGSVLPVALPPLDSTEDLLMATEALERRAQTATKLITAALALADR